MNARTRLFALLALAAPVATPCTVSVTRYLYLNVVRLEGPKVEGLKWFRTYNVLDYEGNEPVLVSRIDQGRKHPVAKWEGGQECSYDPAGTERCAPNRPFSGIGLEAYFGEWKDVSDRRDDLRKLYLPIVVEISGREIRMTLRSWPVRPNRELRSERDTMVVTRACDFINGVEESTSE